MRSLLLIAFIILSSILTNSVSADPKVHLVCGSTAGGPAAEVEVTLDLSNYEIRVSLVNQAYPDGIVGTYQGTLTELGDIFASGLIDGNESSLGLRPMEEGFALNLYARGGSGNTSIEFGFGLHSLCK